MALFKSKSKKEEKPKEDKKTALRQKIVKKESLDAVPSTRLGTSPNKSARALKPGTIRIDQSAEDGELYGKIILKPRITEKTSFITEDGAYTFDVDPRANKVQVKKAIQEIYNVKPIRVNMIAVPAKHVIVRNKPGVRPGGKKAVVYLKEGDRIEFV